MGRLGEWISKKRKSDRRKEPPADAHVKQKTRGEGGKENRHIIRQTWQRGEEKNNIKGGEIAQRLSSAGEGRSRRGKPRVAQYPSVEGNCGGQNSESAVGRSSTRQRAGTILVLPRDEDQNNIICPRLSEGSRLAAWHPQLERWSRCCPPPTLAGRVGYPAPLTRCLAIEDSCVLRRNAQTRSLSNVSSFTGNTTKCWLMYRCNPAACVETG